MVRDGQTGRSLAGALVRGEGGDEATTDEEGRFRLTLPAGADRLVRAATADLCPGEARMDVSEGENAALTVHLYPRLELEEAYLQVGFDQSVRIEASTRCDEQAPLHWRQITGPELDWDHLDVEDGGRVVTLRTHRLDEMVELEPELGVVPFSRTERAEYRLELTAELGGRDERRVVRVTAVPTAAGVYQVPTGMDMYLNGGERAEHRWTLSGKPEDSRTRLVDADGRTPHFRPDRFGQYLLRYEPLGLDITVQAGAHREVPRDCGREGCHRPEDHGWRSTAHARTFRRGLTGALGPTFGPACWSCHATGVDPGLDNGSLLAVARSASWRAPAPHPGAWEEAPRTIRRHGSVWCSACHGPGRILPPPFHWEYGAKFRVGVCARCHDVVGDPDAPHVSRQVREWRRAPMASFVGGEEDPGPAHERGCARCHSAQGFIAWLDGNATFMPAEDSVVAITCTTCHDPHDGENPRALRVFERVEEVSGGPASGLGSGAVCVSCHRSGVARAGDDSAAPHAPQADVLLGRGSKLVRRSEAGAHALLADSCVACHMERLLGTDPMVGRAGGHTFSVRDLEAAGSRHILAGAACASCHGSEVPPQAIGGYRDWDGDGRADNVGEEFSRAVAAAREMLRERIAWARVRDECPGERLGHDFVERNARLVLVDREEALLGDCDGDGAFSGRERPVGVEQISRELRKVIWDVAMLEKDGSRGRHNPRFTFEVLRAVQRELR